MISRFIGSVFVGLAATSCVASRVYVVEAQLVDRNSAAAFEAEKISRAGVIYRKLRDSALRETIVGSQISNDPTDTDLIVTGTGPLHLHKDGTFFQVRNGRIRGLFAGTYSVSADRVCLEAVRGQCFGIYRTKEDRYLRVDVRPEVVLQSVVIERDESLGRNDL